MALLLFVTTVAARAQWQLQDSHSTADLRGIDNVGAGVAWASGTKGTVLRTEDGGYLWQACALPPGADHLDFRGIQAFDSNTAIVMSSGKGDLSRLYKTTDGCQTWKLVFTNPDKDGFWDSILVTSRRTVMMIGDPLPQKEFDRFKVKTYFHFPFFGSVDAGDTWRRLDSNNLFALSDSHGNPTQFIYAASNSSLLEIESHRLIVFAKGGAAPSIGQLQFIDNANPLLCRSQCTLISDSKVPLKSGPTAGAFSVAIDDPNSAEPSVVVVGGDYARPDDPGGTSASCFPDRGMPTVEYFHCDAPATPPHGFRSAVAYDTASKTWITVGPNGTDISTDDGKNWRALHPGPNDPPDADRNWNALSLPFVVGPHGRIGKLNPHALTNTAK